MHRSGRGGKAVQQPFDAPGGKEGLISLNKKTSVQVRHLADAQADGIALRPAGIAHGPNAARPAQGLHLSIADDGHNAREPPARKRAQRIGEQRRARQRRQAACCPRSAARARRP